MMDLTELGHNQNELKVNIVVKKQKQHAEFKTHILPSHCYSNAAVATAAIVC